MTFCLKIIVIDVPLENHRTGIIVSLFVYYCCDRFVVLVESTFMQYSRDIGDVMYFFRQLGNPDT